MTEREAKALAATIEGLRHDVERLAVALRPFAALGDQFSDNAHDDSWRIYERNGIKVYLGHLREARKAIRSVE